MLLNVKRVSTTFCFSSPPEVANVIETCNGQRITSSFLFVHFVKRQLKTTKNLSLDNWSAAKGVNPGSLEYESESRNITPRSPI